MKKIFSLLIILGIIFIIGCAKKETGIGGITGGSVIEEVENTEVIEEAVREEIKTIRFCYDTDNGMVRWVNGKILGFYDNAERFEFNDNCFDDNILVEYYCDEDEVPQNETFVCKNGCVDGHCQ